MTVLAEFPHCQAAIQYCRDIVDLKIPACLWTRLACQRQLDDLDRDWEFYFDLEEAERACRIAELFPHIKGSWARHKKGDPTAHLIRLNPWQKFKRTAMYGWKRRDTGLRRFITCYFEIPRKNGKSVEGAIDCLHTMALDHEPGAEVYIAATTRDQTKHVFQAAKLMAQQTPEFRHKFGVQVHAHSLTQPKTASILAPVSAEANSLDGHSVHVCVIDELHAHKTRGVFDVMDSATGARDQPLIICITTAGSNLAGICYEQHIYLKKILQNIVEDETFFGIIYSIDEDDDPLSPDSWAKANPNLGSSIYLSDLERMATKAKETPAALNNFKTKRLDVWVGALAAAINMENWTKCGDSTLKIEDFTGEECIIGVDLASKIDIAAVCLEFWREGKSVRFYRYYLPENTVKTAPNAQYQGWAQEGRIITTDGARIDYNRIADDLLEDCRRYDVSEIVFDPWQATHMMAILQAEGIEPVELSNTVANFSEPMKELIAEIEAGDTVHDNCPVTKWMYSNVVARIDNKDNIFPRKEAEGNKIDGFVAAIMAHNRWLYRDPAQGPSVYEERGLVTL